VERSLILWEQSLLAMKSPRFQEDPVGLIAGKPCSHKALPNPNNTYETYDNIDCMMACSSSRSNGLSRIGALRVMGLSVSRTSCA